MLRRSTGCSVPRLTTAHRLTTLRIPYYAHSSTLQLMNSSLNEMYALAGQEQVGEVEYNTVNKASKKFILFHHLTCKYRNNSAPLHSAPALPPAIPWMKELYGIIYLLYAEC